MYWRAVSGGPAVWGSDNNVSGWDILRCVSTKYCSFIHSVFDWPSIQTLEPNCLGSNSSSATFLLYDLGKVTFSTCALVSSPVITFTPYVCCMDHMSSSNKYFK